MPRQCIESYLHHLQVHQAAASEEQSSKGQPSNATSCEPHIALVVVIVVGVVNIHCNHHGKVSAYSHMIMHECADLEIDSKQSICGNHVESIYMYKTWRNHRIYTGLGHNGCLTVCLSSRLGAPIQKETVSKSCVSGGTGQKVWSCLLHRMKPQASIMCTLHVHLQTTLILNRLTTALS